MRVLTSHLNDSQIRETRFSKVKSLLCMSLFLTGWDGTYRTLANCTVLEGATSCTLDWFTLANVEMRTSGLDLVLYTTGLLLPTPLPRNTWRRDSQSPNARGIAKDSCQQKLNQHILLFSNRTIGYGDKTSRLRQVPTQHAKPGPRFQRSIAMDRGVVALCLLLSWVFAGSVQSQSDRSSPCKAGLRPPSGGRCVRGRCFNSLGRPAPCIASKITRPVEPLPGPQLQTPHGATRTVSGTNGKGQAGPLSRRRRLQQLAGIGNYLVGAQIAANQQEVLTAGVLSQLANFHGVEGLGFRHNLGALPSPGAVEMMALAGGSALTGSQGIVPGLIGQAIQSVINPMTLASAGGILPNSASAQNGVNWLGAPGLAGLLSQGPQSVGALESTAQANFNTLGAEQVSNMPLYVDSHAGIADSGAGAAALITQASQAAGNTVKAKGHLAGAMVSTAGQVAGTLVSTAGQIKGQLISNAAQVKGSVMDHAADVKGQIITGAGQMAGQAVTGIARAAEIVAENKDEIMGVVGTTVGTALKNAGELLLSKANGGASHAAYTSSDYSDYTWVSDSSDTGGSVYYHDGDDDYDVAHSVPIGSSAVNLATDAVVAPSLQLQGQAPAPVQQSTSSNQPAAAAAVPSAAAMQVSTPPQGMQTGQGQ